MNRDTITATESPPSVTASKGSVDLNWQIKTASYHHYLHTCPKLSLCFYSIPIKLMTRHESILFILSLPVPRWQVSFVSMCMCLTFPIWLTFPLKDFSKLKDLWIIRNLTKLNNKIINKINHHSNYFIHSNT